MIKQVFNAKTQQNEDVVWSVDQANELICIFADGHFYKFPAGITEEELQTLIDEHEAANTGQEVLTPEVLAAQEKAAAEAQTLVDSLNGTESKKINVTDGNTMPEETKTNDSPEPTTEPTE